MAVKKEKKAERPIGIIGCGAMGAAIAQRLAPHHALYLFDQSSAKAAALALETKGRAAHDVSELLSAVDLFFLAVKPQDLPSCSAVLKPHLTKQHQAFSIVTGASLATLRELLAPARALRLMPNLPIACGKGVIAIADGALFEVSDRYAEAKSRVEQLLTPLGTIHWLAEEKMDAVTSLTGSGPAFVCLLIEAMVDAAIAMGFHAKEAYDLVLAMMAGSIELLQREEGDAAALRHRISSPAGTTIAGIKELERHGVRYGLIAAFEAAYTRARTLGTGE